MKKKLFSEVLEIKNGKNQRAVENPNGKYPIYGSGGEIGRANDFICEAETIIVGRKGTINNPIFVNESFWNVDTAFGLCANRELLYPKYLFYFCKSFDFNTLSTTVTIPSLTKTNLLGIKIPLPSLPEQQKIAAELDKIQSAIDNKKQQLSLLDEAIKSEFTEMFSTLNCEIKTIEETCTMKSGTTFSKDEESDSGEVFYIKVSGMNLPENDKYIKTSFLFVSRKVAGKTIIPANSIIFPKRGGAIGTNKKRITEQEICIDLNTMAVTPSNELNIQYLYQFFQNLDMGKLFNGSTVPQINNKDIGPLKIKVPPLELQNKFASFVQQIDTTKTIIKTQLKDLNELLESKMDFYFME